MHDKYDFIFNTHHLIPSVDLLVLALGSLRLGTGSSFGFSQALQGLAVSRQRFLPPHCLKTLVTAGQRSAGSVHAAHNNALWA